jgi:hypothetical protein
MKASTDGNLRWADADTPFAGRHMEPMMGFVLPMGMLAQVGVMQLNQLSHPSTNQYRHICMFKRN